MLNLPSPSHQPPAALPEREALRAAFAALAGLTAPADGALTKADVRDRHHPQRTARAERERAFVLAHAPRHLHHFADGRDVSPTRIHPEVRLVGSDPDAAALFRLASLLWSVPVSRGVGRRTRFLVWDRANDKLLGLFALGSPVFNLRARDGWAGWDASGRAARLRYVLDAFVLGAVPPYNLLLGGKLVAALTVTTETRHLLGTCHPDPLLAVTVTSALGRSSLYNRLRLPGLVTFERLGWSAGWGHFHVPQPLFARLRNYLAAVGHPYAQQHCFHGGPNWRLRLLRAGLDALGLPPEAVLRHGVRREVFAATTSPDAQAFLRAGGPVPSPVPVAQADVVQAAKDRWIVPRGVRRPDYKAWRTSDTVAALRAHFVVETPAAYSGVAKSGASGIAPTRRRASSGTRSLTRTAA